MASIISPNMSLIIPGVGTEAGPTYAFDVNSSLTLIDQHDHTPGRGIQITPAGLDINVDLTMGDNSLIDVKSIIFEAQSSTSDLQQLYVAPGVESPLTQDLWYRDGNGVAIQLTLGGSVNATIASIPGESYAAGTFFWKQGAGSTVPANFDIGSVVIRPNTAGTTNGVRLTPPGGISSQYDLILPNLPSVNSFMALDNSGNITAVLPIAKGIAAANITDGTITPALITQFFGLIPTGAIIPYGGTSAPSGYLLCDGTSYLRTAQADLFSVISTAYGAADGTHFNVPDLRGQFLRGVSGASANDPDKTSRTAMTTGGNTGNNVGSIQTSTFTSHLHSALVSYWNGEAGGIVPPSINGPFAGGALSNTPAGSLTTSNGAVSIGSTGGNETRPINAYVNYLIKN